VPLGARGHACQELTVLRARDRSLGAAKTKARGAGMNCQQPLLLQGGPFDLDGAEVDDNFGTVRVIKDFEGQDHVYYVLRDWTLDRWVGKHQNTRKVATV
jgi:hypothetical protein